MTGASGTAGWTRGAHPSGTGIAWLGGSPAASRGVSSGLFFLFFPLQDLRSARRFPLQRPRRPLPGRAAVLARLKGAARRPERTGSRRARRARRASRGAWAAGGAEPWAPGAAPRRPLLLALGAGPRAWPDRRPRPPDPPRDPERPRPRLRLHPAPFVGRNFILFFFGFPFPLRLWGGKAPRAPLLSAFH